MANQYRSILAGGAAGTGGDALPAEVLTGKTFTNDDGAQTGTMPNRGAVSGTASPDAPYTIPEGYHNGEGVVTGVGLHNVAVGIANGVCNIIDLATGDAEFISFSTSASTVTLNGITYTVQMTDSANLVATITANRAGKYSKLTSPTSGTATVITPATYTADAGVTMAYSSAGGCSLTVFEFAS